MNEKYKVSVLLLADYVLYKCFVDTKYITNFQLQIILYYIQTNCLKNGFIAFDDRIEWDGLPYIPVVYKKWCVFGGLTIPWYFFGEVKINTTLKSIADDVIIKLRELSTKELEHLLYNKES